MTDIAFKTNVTKRPIRDVTTWDRLKVNRDWLGFWFMLPAAAFLVLFLAYPLGLGIWMSFTDIRIGRGGAYVGTENYEWLLGTTSEWWDWLRKAVSGHAGSLPGDSILWLSIFNTILYTTVASVIKFAVGLYLALLLNQHMPFKAI